MGTWLSSLLCCNASPHQVLKKHITARLLPVLFPLVLEYAGVKSLLTLSIDSALGKTSFYKYYDLKLRVQFCVLSPQVFDSFCASPPTHVLPGDPVLWQADGKSTEVFFLQIDQFRFGGEEEEEALKNIKKLLLNIVRAELNKRGDRSEPLWNRRIANWHSLAPLTIGLSHVWEFSLESLMADVLQEAKRQGKALALGLANETRSPQTPMHHNWEPDFFRNFYL